MNKPFPILLTSVMFLSACASSNTHSRQAEDFIEEVQSSPELQEVDVSLDELKEKTEELTAEYETLQAGILPYASFDTDNSDKADKLVIYINENNVMNVNNKTMSRNDFTIYIDKVLPGLCTPSPSISIHKKADFDTAAWVLDALYSRGCADVKIE